MKPQALLAALILTACSHSPLSIEDTADNPVAILPMDVSGGRPIIELPIDGEEPLRVVLDTGATMNVVASAAVQRLDLQAVGEIQVSSPGGEPFATPEVTLPDMSVGSAKVEGLTAAHLSNGPVSMVSRDGVIGPVAFSKFGRVALNFIDYTVEIGGEFDLPPDVAWIPFGEDRPLLDARLEIGGMYVPAHIDTGSPGIVKAPIGYSRAFDLEDTTTVIGRARLVDRVLEVYGSPFRQDAKIGSAIIPIDELQFFERPYANIGTGALHGLVLEIDWENERYAIWGHAEPRRPQRQRRTPSQDD